MSLILPAFRRTALSRHFAAVALLLLIFAPIVRGQSKLTEPVYRVATEPTAAQTGTDVVVSTEVPNVQRAGVVLDFTQQPGEHPLAPAIRVCRASLEEIDRISAQIHRNHCIMGPMGDKDALIVLHWQVRQEILGVAQRPTQDDQAGEHLRTQHAVAIGHCAALRKTQ